MIQRFKEWMLTWTFVDNAIRARAFELFLKDSEDFDEHADKILTREILKVKDFSQVKRQLSPDERKAYAAAASLVYNSEPFKDIIKEIQYDQMIFMSLQSENDRQLMIGRGTINGADLVESRMAALDVEHQQNMKDAQPVESSQIHEPINKLEIN